jgi:hypothetical protein
VILLGVVLVEVAFFPDEATYPPNNDLADLATDAIIPTPAEAAAIAAEPPAATTLPVMEE